MMMNKTLVCVCNLGKTFSIRNIEHTLVVDTIHCIHLDEELFWILILLVKDMSKCTLLTKRNTNITITSFCVIKYF